MDFFEVAIKIILVVCILLLVVFVIFIATFLPLAYKEELATIKIKERIAENGIELTTTQINELIDKEVDND